MGCNEPHRSRSTHDGTLFESERSRSNHFIKQQDGRFRSNQFSESVIGPFTFDGARDGFGLGLVYGTSSFVTDTWQAKFYLVN